MATSEETSFAESIRAVAARAAYGYFAWRLMQARKPLTLLGEQAQGAYQDVLVASEDVDAATFEEIVVGAISAFTRDVKRGTGDIIRHACCGSVFQIVYPLLESYLATLKKPTGAQSNCGPLIAGQPFSKVLWAARSAFAHQDEWQRKGSSAHSLGIEAQAVLRAVGIADPATANAHDIYIRISGGSLDEFLRRVLASALEVSENVVGNTPIPPLWGIVRAVAIGRLLLTGFVVMAGQGKAASILGQTTISVPLRTGKHAVIDLGETVARRAPGRWLPSTSVGQQCSDCGRKRPARSRSSSPGWIPGGSSLKS